MNGRRQSGGGSRPAPRRLFEVPWETFAPRTEAERYRIYGRIGKRLDLLATTPDAGGIGTALIELHQDEKTVGRRLADRGLIGVLDGVNNEWIALPWERDEQPLTMSDPSLPGRRPIREGRAA